MSRRVSYLLLAPALAAALALSACGSNDLGTQRTGSNPSSSVKDVKKDDALAARLPQKIKDAKKITVATDPTYPPNEFMDADGKTVKGMDADLMKAIGQKLGVEVEMSPGTFDSLIMGIKGGKYDMGASSFTINEKRMAEVNMVSYLSAGTLWATAKGNPKGIDPKNICGKTVALQTGTVQDTEDMPKREAECKAKGQPINVLKFPGQTDVTTALVSGKADAMLADSPVVSYAVMQTKDKLETVGDVYDAAPYGLVVPKEQTELANVMQEALTQLEKEGVYKQVLATWGNEKGAITKFEVNPNFGVNPRP